MLWVSESLSFLTDLLPIFSSAPNNFFNEYNSLYSKKETLQKTYKSAEKEINALNRKLDNLNQYLNRSSSVQQTNDRKPEKNQTTLWFCPSKKVYRIEVFNFITIHLDVCGKLLLLFLLIFFFLVFSTFVLSCIVLHIRSVF